MNRLPAWLAMTLVLVLTLGTLVAVAVRAEFSRGLSPADWAAVRFTLSQALVSAVVSVALAIPAARALARRTFRGRRALITLMGAPFLLPVIVAIIGLLAVFGRGGMVNAALGAVGLPQISIYGFFGVVLAHVFFNLPLAVRLILEGWQSIPAERFRLTATLNGSVFRLLELPMLARAVPSAVLVVFLICLTSFAVALTLGGGPRATTVELAIYQAIQFDFDLGRAALLACIQFALGLSAAFVAWQITPDQGMGRGLDRVVQRWDSGHPAIDASILTAVTLFLALPLAMVVLRGAPGLLEMPDSVWIAAWRSVFVATASAILCIGLTLALALRGGLAASVIGVLPLAASGLVMGTGLFVVVHPFVSPSSLALLVTVLVNATLALPFAVRAVGPAVVDIQRDYGMLSQSLGLSAWDRLRLIIVPRTRRSLGFAAGLSAALSMGDLGVITLFAGNTQETLPLAMYRLMGAYMMDAAAGAGLLLLVLSLMAFWLCDQWGPRDVDA